jgi:hypothetical protein
MLRAHKEFAVHSCLSRFVQAERRNQCSVSLCLYCVGLSDSGTGSEKQLNGTAATQHWLIAVAVG